MVLKRFEVRNSTAVWMSSATLPESTSRVVKPPLNLCGLSVRCLDERSRIAHCIASRGTCTSLSAGIAVAMVRDLTGVADAVDKADVIAKFEVVASVAKAVCELGAGDPRTCPLRAGELNRMYQLGLHSRHQRVR